MDALERVRLFALSFLMLFVELALIRWTAANDIHLAYLTNFVLLASFLGIGIGFLRSARGPDLLPWAPVPGVGPTDGNELPPVQDADGNWVPNPQNSKTSKDVLALVLTGGGSQVVAAGRPRFRRRSELVGAP